MSKKKTKVSKFLSLVLRHSPQTIGIELDESGWVDVDVLLIAAEKSGTPISKEFLEEVVFTNDKQRFGFSPDAAQIRANQGHSLDIDLQLDPVHPPAILYHGTATRFMEKILQVGLQKMNRQHVHLSSSPEQAERVGSRHGKPIVLSVQCEAMNRVGYQFYLSANGVWLTDSVPTEFIVTPNSAPIVEST